MKKRFFYTLGVLLVLTSCDGFNISQFFNSSSSTTSYNTSYDSATSYDTTNNFYQAKNLRYTLRDTNSQLGWQTSLTTGEQSFLIVPVDFSDYYGKSKGWTQEKLSNINKIFFGDSEDVAYESVKSYFNKSSYGKLNITGEVANVFKSSYTLASASRLGDYVADKVIEQYYSAANSSLLKKYDKDGDGFVDNCVFVYSNTYSRTSTSTFWAWCSASMTETNVNKPTINNYMWVSYEFSNDKYDDNYNSSKPETHTFIHETGHMLGLDDYYCYDDENSWNCAGELDMQSYNVGDHNAYSKMALGWIDPYVVTNSCQINLKTSSKYPEAILINDNWNGSSFDEYILIEYYTPTGLNEIDAKHSYSKTQMYNYNGLRIYHVDARLIKAKISGNSLVQSNDYVDEIDFDDYYNCYIVGASNSVNRSYLRSNQRTFRYLHLLDQGGNNNLNRGYGGKVEPSSALWTGSKQFTPSAVFFAGGTKFNDKSEIGYSVSVSNLTDEDCLVTITKK